MSRSAQKSRLKSTTADRVLALKRELKQDFAQPRLADQKQQDKDRQGYTLLLAMRSWEFEAFATLRR